MDTIQQEDLGLELIDFVDNKISLCQKILDSKIGGSYFEVYLILSSVISGIASLIWPGRGIDRKRFVELLIRFDSSENEFSRISTPLLLDNFKNSSITNIEVFKKYQEFQVSRILTGSEIDFNENYIVNVTKEIVIKDLRSFSYANIFYSEVRSSIVHQYELSKIASLFPMTIRRELVSYNNYLEKPNRRICFNIQEMMNRIKLISTNVFREIKMVPQKTPISWWVDG